MLTASRECQHEQVQHGSRLLPQAFKRAACKVHDGTGGPLLQWHCFGAASLAAQPGLCLEQLGVASEALEIGSASRRKVRNCFLQAATLGMRKRMAVSTRACGICSGELCDFGKIASASEEAQAGQPGPGWAAQAGKTLGRRVHGAAAVQALLP